MWVKPRRPEGDVNATTGPTPSLLRKFRSLSQASSAGDHLLANIQSGNRRGAPPGHLDGFGFCPASEIQDRMLDHVVPQHQPEQHVEFVALSVGTWLFALAEDGGPP